MHRILLVAWCVIGVAAVAAALSPPARALERNRQAVGAFSSMLKSVEDVRSSSTAPGSTPELRTRLLSQAMQDSMDCQQILGKHHPQALFAVRVQQALLVLESGRAFHALDELLELAEEDRPQSGSPWTASTPLVEAALAETRYKIALMCKDEGDGFDNWLTKFAEPAARGFQDLAEHAAPGEEKKRFLNNLAVCTRLIYGNHETSHSLGFPACRTVDCALVARQWKRPPPGGGGGGGGSGDGSNGEPWVEPPPPPNENTQGR